MRRGLLSRRSAFADVLIGTSPSRMAQSAPSKPPSICVRERSRAMLSGVVGLTPLFQAAWALALFPTQPVGRIQYSADRGGVLA